MKPLLALNIFLSVAALSAAIYAARLSREPAPAQAAATTPAGPVAAPSSGTPPANLASVMLEISRLRAEIDALKRSVATANSTGVSKEELEAAIKKAVAEQDPRQPADVYGEAVARLKKGALRILDTTAVSLSLTAEQRTAIDKTLEDEAEAYAVLVLHKSSLEELKTGGEVINKRADLRVREVLTADQVQKLDALPRRHSWFGGGYLSEPVSPK